MTDISSASVEVLNTVRYLVTETTPEIQKRASPIMAQKVIYWASDIIGATCEPKEIKDILLANKEFSKFFMEWVTGTIDMPWIFYNKTVSKQVAVLMKLDIYLTDY